VPADPYRDNLREIPIYLLIAPNAIRKDAPVLDGCQEKNQTTVQRSSVEPRKEHPMKCDKYMGMDVHQAMTVVVVLDVEGK